MEKKFTSLKDIGNQIPFRVPENYFEKFAIQMESQISGTVVSLKSMFRTWGYMAAMFVGVLLIGHVFYNIHQNRLYKTEKLESYFLSQIDDLTLLDIYLEEFGYY